MNPQTRTQRNTIKTRTRQQRATARITRRGTGTLASHCIAAGATPKQAKNIAQTLRKEARKSGITGQPARIHAGRHMRNATRYTRAEVTCMAAHYNARKPAYKLIRTRLTLAA